ncbi:hypothetical protein IW261DRAFT_653356 [Armillaria novae-zelandiae]|uniref:F-box domain-containing protein n=1 Tax=Armillaria novae-zelandiae TaxID=153914 RepID=A0AA39ULH8_9AGAR|nr:hypothetical protein IW261DRAFT_653356 [Armillaria novae-zelandiae]
MPSLVDVFVQLIVRIHTSKLDYKFPESFTLPLTANDSLAICDAEALLKLTQSVATALRSITSDMNCLASAHSQLKSIRDHLLLVDADLKKAAMPPIQRLPAEMLMEIFKYASDQGDSGGGDALSLRWGPFAVSRVCRRWRTIAMENCPEIWAHFGLDRHIWDCMKDPVSILSLVLSCSKNWPLKIQFEAIGFADEDTDEDSDSDSDGEDSDSGMSSHTSWRLKHSDDAVTERLIQLLVEQCHRWKDFYIDAPDRLIHHLSLIRGRLQSLVIFQMLHHKDGLPPVRPLQPIDPAILDGAPLLESVHIFECYGANSQAALIAPCLVPKLKSFSDKRRKADGAHYLEIIRTNPALKRLSVEHEGTFTVTTPDIVHSSITSLTTCNGSFLRSIRLPSLERACLAGFNESQPHHAIASLYDLINRSMCSLTSLGIQNCPVDHHLILALEASPELTILDLRFFKWEAVSISTMESLVIRLNTQSTRPALVPKLQSLRLLLAESSAIDPGIVGMGLGTAIEDQWRERTLLSVCVTVCVTVWPPGRFGNDMGLSGALQVLRAMLDPLRQEGLDLLLFILSRCSVRTVSGALSFLPGLAIVVTHSYQMQSSDDNITRTSFQGQGLDAIIHWIERVDRAILYRLGYHRLA